MKTRRNRIPRLGLALALAGAALVPAAAAAQFTRDFDLERCTFAADGRQNPYFSLHPGDRLILNGEDDGEAVRVAIIVTGNTKPITFQTPEGHTVSLQARVVVEREWVDGELVEVSRNWLARCVETNDVFYFGEAVTDFEDGEVVGHEGEWEAGVDGAQPGLLIPARFLLAARYFQEIAPDVALDRARNVEMGLEVTAAGETFQSCVKVSETSPLEPGSESIKVYCPGVGLVQDDDIFLTSYERD